MVKTATFPADFPTNQPGDTTCMSSQEALAVGGSWCGAEVNLLKGEQKSAEFAGLPSVGVNTNQKIQPMGPQGVDAVHIPSA